MTKPKTFTALGIPIVLKAQRVFTITYYCDDCPKEWTEQILTQTYSYCPCCDAKVEPGTVEEHEEELPEFDI